MRLTQWLEKKNMPLLKFSQIANVPYNTVWHWVHRKRYPSLVHAVQIEKLTQNEVTCMDWIEDTQDLVAHLKRKNKSSQTYDTKKKTNKK